MEDYKKILAISGKSGLHKLVGQMKNGIVAESITDGKRFPVYMSENTSSLEDISIYTEEGELPLKDVFKKIHKETTGKASDISLKDSKALTTFFKKIVPNYDVDRVYASDIKKVIKWYNYLLEAKMLILEEKKTTKKTDGAKKESSKKTVSKKKTTKNAPKKVPLKKAANTSAKKMTTRKAPVKK